MDEDGVEFGLTGEMVVSREDYALSLRELKLIRFDSIGSRAAREGPKGRERTERRARGRMKEAEKKMYGYCKTRLHLP